MSAPLCENCVKPGDQQSGAATGRVSTYAGVKCYLAGDHQTNAILFATDIFGHLFLNNQKAADAFAAAGFTVVIPKTLNDAMPVDQPDAMAKIGEWFQRNPTEHATEVCRTVLAQMAQDYTLIQMVGFCYGARMVADLLPVERRLRSGVLFHPSRMTPEDVPRLRQAAKPMFFPCAETDRAFTPELRQMYEAELAKVPGTRFKVYPGTQHGFGIRPTGEVAQKASEEAREDATAFFRENAE